MQDQKNYEYWKQSNQLDAELKKELETLSMEDIKDRFSLPLEFGTGGLRGKMGVGISRVNVHTIMQAASGFGMYLKRHFKQGKVAISYDNRHDSKRFAIKSAEVLAYYGIESLVFENLRPTPVLSYAVRHFGCIGGIVVTASHNPKEDNGFKAYNHTGAQLNLEEASEVIDYILGITNIFDVKTGDTSLISYIDEDFDALYYEAIKDVTIQPKRFDKKIVYSPLHGTGGQVIPKFLRQLGYDVHEVIEEMIPDPNFTYTKSSNPEQQDAYINSLALAKKIDADLILITDPDADRLGVAVKHQGDYVLLTGNQTAAIELHYILSERQKRGTLPKDGLVYTTIVTSDIIKTIAASFQIDVITTLTGFKFIGEQANIQTRPYLFGCEESYGSLIIDSVRDKDAVQACLLLAEIASLSEDKTLVDYIDYLYNTHGYYLEVQDNFFFEGIEGKETMQKLLDTLRKKPLDIEGFEIQSIADYLASERYEHGQTTSIDLPVSNVLSYTYNQQTVVLRPSGTEPKLKLYFGIKASSKDEASKILNILQVSFKSFIGAFK